MKRRDSIEQFSIYIRYLDPKLNVCDDFLRFLPVTDDSGKGLGNSVMHYLLTHAWSRIRRSTSNERRSKWSTDPPHVLFSSGNLRSLCRTQLQFGHQCSLRSIRYIKNVRKYWKNPSNFSLAQETKQKEILKYEIY